jgi:hypothetical protein
MFLSWNIKERVLEMSSLLLLLILENLLLQLSVISRVFNNVLKLIELHIYWKITADVTIKSLLL